ncbi:MAG TPA: sigma-70 family RNA polymerase sigma factor [Acidimicrobiales bacterium]|nr:sigma-70 family RNA polymerase sigma factor [Acidimicrobiales bacterium]
MSEPDPLTQRFEAHRDHLRAVALRMLGSTQQADDAVQQAWLRFNSTDASTVDNLGGWLTTVVARICLDVLRARAAKPEAPLDEAPESLTETSPEDEAILADSVGLALLVVLDTLAPAERLAFVLHDLFAVPFEEIAPIVGRTPAAARQLASRARRRLQTDQIASNASAATQREVVAAFLAASRQGDFAGLLRLLDPEVVLRADPTVVGFGASAEARGPEAVAQTFAGRAEAARLTLIDGLAGAVWSVGGRPRVVFSFTVRDGRVVGIDLLGDPVTLEALELEPLRQ